MSELIIKLLAFLEGVVEKLLPLLLSYKLGKATQDNKTLTKEVEDVKKVQEIRNSTAGLSDAELDKWLHDNQG